MSDTTAKAPRFMFLDVLRGIAVLWMVQVHITNRILLPDLRHGWFFDALNISNGFVAPTFIFCAGGGLWIALSRKGEVFRSFTPQLLDYLRRLAYILFWAFALHVPIFSLQAMLNVESSAVLASGLQFDVLHTIVFSSLGVLALHAATRSLRITTIASGILAALVMTCTALFWQSPMAASLPWPLSVALTDNISPFPLIPWCCYFLAGICFTGWFLQAKDMGRAARRVLLGGLLLPFAIFAVKNTVVTPWAATWWTSSPGMHLFRISATVLCIGALFLLERRMQDSRLARSLQTVGSESLFLYVSHLLIVYGQVGTIVLGLLGIEHTGYAGVAVSWLIVMGVLLPAMYAWHAFKKKRPVLARRILAVQIAWMIISFIITPEHFTLFGG